MVNIGPAFKVYAEADATLNAHVNMSVGIEYALIDAKLYFPDTTGLSGSFNPVESSECFGSPIAAASTTWIVC